jgi:enolase
MKIKNIKAREILDSRGWPTVECKMILDNGQSVKASVPSGASVGKLEAVELRDGDKKRYSGKGVLNAIKNIETIIAPVLIGREIDTKEIDKILIELDGTENKSGLGANAVLPISIATIRAQALQENMQLYKLISKLSGTEKTNLPRIMFNILNGGVHADNGIAFQEFMIMPLKTDCVSETIHVAAEVYHKLKKILSKNGYSVGVGDEGGFAPLLKDDQKDKECEALDFLLQATEEAGFMPVEDVVFCLDVAASQFYDSQSGLYKLNSEELSAQNLINVYKNLCNKYPIFSIEDGLAEDDWDGWKLLTQQLGEKVQLVGDDIFVSNKNIIKKGIDEGVANSVLIKPNQVGTVTETLDAISVCKENNYKTVVSHRSGETVDTFIADLVVGTNAGQFKCGACVRGERVTKYNRLMEIEIKY